MGEKDHRQASEQSAAPARCAVITVSDTRTAADDVSGKLGFEILTKFGHTVVETRIVKNDPRAIRSALDPDPDRRPASAQAFAHLIGAAAAL